MAGYGLGTRIRATLARILIPGPATDPRLWIRSPGACLRSTDGGDFWTDFGLLTDSFDLNFYLEKVCSLSAFEGGTAFCCEIWIKTRNRRYGLFKLLSSFLHESRGGIGGPNPPNGALGSPVKTSRNLFRRKKSNFNTRVCFLRLLLRDLYGPSHI